MSVRPVHFGVFIFLAWVALTVVVAAAGADEELDRLLLEKSEVPITKPRGYKPPEQIPEMPQPGSEVVNRRCRIVYRADTGWYLLTFLAGRETKTYQRVMPRWVLPSRQLELIESEIKSARRPVFQVSGETTIYKGRAFIMLRNVRIERRRRKPPAPQPVEDTATAATTVAPAKSTSPAGAEGTAAATPAQPTTAPAGRAPVADQAEDILSGLLDSKLGEPVIVPVEPGRIERAPSVAPSEKLQVHEDRGEMRIDRLVVITPDSNNEWWLAHFDSDNTLQDQPMRLLPCKKLEKAEKWIADARNRTVRMRISGVKTVYKGHEYLLLRKVLKANDMGQFSSSGGFLDDD